MNLSLSHCLSLEERTKPVTRRPRRTTMTKRVKQLYEPLTKAEIAHMSVADRRARLELCEHQLANKERVLEWMDAKPYMLAEVAGLRSNIAALKAAIS